MDAERERRRRNTRCSFCGKGQDRVRKLVAGPNVYICDECVELCHEVLEEERRTGPPPHKGSTQATTASTVRKRASLWDRLRCRLWRVASLSPNPAHEAPSS